MKNVIAGAFAWLLLVGGASLIVLGVVMLCAGPPLVIFNHDWRLNKLCKVSAVDVATPTVLTSRHPSILSLLLLS